MKQGRNYSTCEELPELQLLILFSYLNFSQPCDTEKILQVLAAIRSILYVAVSPMITSDIVGS